MVGHCFMWIYRHKNPSKLFVYFLELHDEQEPVKLSQLPVPPLAMASM